MSRIVAATLLLLILALTVHAAPWPHPPRLWQHGFVPVPLTTSKLELFVPYPGPRISHVCGVELRASGAFGLPEHYTLLALQLVVHDSTGRKDLTAQGPNLVYRFASQGTYLTTITIRTKGKGTFGDAIRRALRGNPAAAQVQLIALPVVCAK